MPSSVAFILNSNINAHAPKKNNKNKVENEEYKVHATSLFPKIALSGTKE